MNIENEKIFLNDAFYDGGLVFDETITTAGTVVRGGLDAEGWYLIPRLVDIHSHGANGADASDGDPEGLVRLSRWYAVHGVTSWCPTIMTLGENALRRAVRSIRDFSRPADGAKIAGINLEGPFLSREKCGSQNVNYLRAPTLCC